MIRLISGSAVVAALVALAPTLPAQQAVFVSRSEVVRLEVLATQSGRPLLGLTSGDFTILDNGVPQKIEHFSFDELPLDLMLTFDVSGSMTGERLDDLREAGRALLEALKPADRAAFLSFSEALSLGAPLSVDREAVRAALNRGVARGHTSLIDACFAGLVLGASSSGRSMLMVFSDGMDTSSWLSTEAVIDAARRASTVVTGVAIGRTRANFLDDLAELTGGSALQLESTRNLRAVFLRLLAEQRQRYLLGYTPTGVSSEGWHKLDVRVSRRGADVKTRAGYQGR
jgi:VWFA-related protein